jgi:4-amino-4-deoxy-L-arabinose transferase-like glycosyltransferase
MTDHPGAGRSAENRGGWFAPIALVVLLGGLLFVGLGRDLPLRSHEALLAETARNMYLDRPVQLADGSRPSPWIVPNFNDIPRLRKTPLPYWAVAGLAQLTGAVDEWTARLPSALAALGTALIVLTLVRRWDGRLASLAAAAALVTAAEFLIVARSALADMSLTFFCTASLAALWMAVETGGARRMGWLIVTGAAAGLAMLAKGPVPALVLPLPCVVAAVLMVARLLRESDASAIPREAHAGGGMPHGATRRAEWAWLVGGAAAGTLLFLAIALPWPAYVWLRVPQAADIWRAESVDRSMGDYGHQEAFYFYIIRLPLLLAPWIVFFIHGLVLAAWRAWREPAERPRLLFLGAWFVGTLGALSAAAGKQDHYILPLVPACAAYIAMSLRHWLEPATPQIERTGRRLISAHAFVLYVVGMLGLMATMDVAVRFPAVISMFPMIGRILTPEAAAWSGYLAVIAFVGGGAAHALIAFRRTRGGLAVLIATFAALFLVASATLIGMADRASVAAGFGRQVRGEVPAGAPLYSFTDSNNTVIFYAGRAIPILPAAKSVREQLARGGRFYLVCRDKHLALLKEVAGLATVAHQEDPIRPGEGFSLLAAGAK